MTKPYKCVIVPNTRRVKLRSITWTVLLSAGFSPKHPFKRLMHFQRMKHKVGTKLHEIYYPR